jgi:hypothetical protein
MEIKFFIRYKFFSLVLKFVGKVKIFDYAGEEVRGYYQGITRGFEKRA